MANPVEIAKTRPAETAMPIATVIAALISKALGVEDTDTIFYIALLVSFVPAAVTWTVDLMRKRSQEKIEPVGVSVGTSTIEPVQIKPMTETVAEFVDEPVTEPVTEPVVDIEPVPESKPAKPRSGKRSSSRSRPKPDDAS